MLVETERRGLGSQIWRLSDAAKQSGALLPLITETHAIPEGPGAFQVRLLTEQSAKPKQPISSASPPVDPFLPYDERMLVAKLSETHVCLLNKFPVIAGHSLIVTRGFEHQTQRLNESDFDALSRVLIEVDGLGFYNAGKTAGASEPHKHLQVVPLPLTSDTMDAPIADWFGHSELPFPHRHAKLPPSIWERPEYAAEEILVRYDDMMRAFDLDGAGGTTEPYNLLVTRRWMLLVPRRREHYAGFSINGLGFAGSLLVKDSAQLQVLQTEGPMVALRHVAG